MIDLRARCVAACLIALVAPHALAQHEGHNMPGTRMPSMTGPLGISMERMGSGTTWIPDAVRLPSRHVAAGNWMVMLHGWAFLQQDWQGGDRGDSQFGSLNWGMIMADRALGGGKLQLRFMPSLDPATVGKCGYPLLLQSGETCNGQAIVDRQHPHDFFMELGALYERSVSSNLAFLVYAAPAGEPALGPVAFMHRPSAMDEPQAPLGHHWQDATHISYGVVTGGLFTRRVRVEISRFNGHEPDESRWNFDRIDLNSIAGRISINPTDNWSFTAGYGLLDNPEGEVPAEDMSRFVASAMHGRRLSNGQWSTTAIFGINRHDHGDPTRSGLLESEIVLGRNTAFSRMELIEKSAHDLSLGAFPDERTFTVGAASVGVIRDFGGLKGAAIGLGGRASMNVVPATLVPAYGSRTPLGGMVFLRARFAGN
jgi:hypothetical protein